MIDRKKLKADARQAMREAKPHPVWVTLAISAIVAVLIFLSLYISGSIETYGSLIRQALSGGLMRSVMSGGELGLSSEGTGGFGSLLVMALELMAALLSAGYMLYCLRLTRHVKASVGDVFDIFGMFLRAVALRVMKSLLLLMFAMLFAVAFSFILTAALLGVSLALYNEPERSADLLLTAMNAPWFLPLSAALTYIPMFIASYFYRLGEYFMFDNPGMSAFQCLAMSRMAMHGRKLQLFLLDLSFIGWYLLSAVPFAALWVQPYITVTTANFYNETAPAFMQDMERKLRARQETIERPPEHHGYHVPGQDRDDETE